LAAVTRCLLLVALLATAFPSHRPLTAQGLPPYAPINPAAASRTTLGFEPYRPYRGDRWTAALALDYASAIEHRQTAEALYDLDAELLRVRLRLARDLSSAAFVQLDVEGGGSYAGFLDGFLDWYHGLLGIDLPERDRRPSNEFLWQIEPRDSPVLERQSSDFFFGDLRLAAGLRLTPAFQTLATVTLPTNTGPEGYGRGVVAAGLLTSVRVPLAQPLLYEGSIGVGVTPRHGDLSAWQNTTMVSASSGLRWRFWGRQSLYGNVFYHRPYYENTGINELDRRELSFDFGWILATHRGREWRIGMTEDLEPGGPAIDLVFRLGRS
jgi:uncharacterized protein DUF3187